MKPETKFWKKLKRLIPSGHVIRVENPAHPGTPDVNACVQGREIWLELKQVLRFPKKPETPVFSGALRPEQVLWHFLRHRAGGKSHIAGYVEEDDRIFLIEGRHSREFNEMPRARLEELNLPLETLWTDHT